jgi:sulfopropanediol 3-dehydrogenase
MPEYLKKAPPKAPADVAQVRETVARIIADVRARGLDAVREYSRTFDRWDPSSFKVGPDEIERAKASIAPDVLSSLDFAHAQIRSFAQRQRDSLVDFEVETQPGVFLGQKQIPVASAGAYVPGGKYPMLMSAQMTILTAKVAGVERVVACAPPYQAKGVFPEMLWSMALAGADEIWCVGGVQALALMACGAEDHEPVDFIAGPGNMYVAEAKRQLFGDVGIDLLAGPTEMLIIADDTSDPRIVAADLLGQAEHGPTSPAWLVSLSRDMAVAVLAEIDRQLAELSTREIAEISWRDCGEVVVVGSRAEAVAVADEYAPEHLEVQTSEPAWFFEKLRNYGTLCIGEEATIAFSDKAIGTNHTLPTEKAARYTGGLCVGKFLKTVTFQRCTREGALLIAPHAGRLSDAEHMFGHGKTAYARLDKYGHPAGAD